MLKQSVYEVKATLKDGRTVDLTPALTSLSWQAQPGEIAQRASLSLAAAETREGNLAALLPLCTLLSVYADGKEVFRGVVWEMERRAGEGNQGIQLTCYDHFIYAQNSDFCSFFPEGMQTQQIVASICSDSGIALQYDYDSISHAAVKASGKTVAEQILSVIQEAERQLKTEAVLLFEAQKLTVRKKGSNSEIYCFEEGKGVISAEENMTLDGLITVAVVAGREGKDQRRPIEDKAVGKTEYGNLVKYVFRDGNNTLAAAKAEAQKLIDEHGKPKRTLNVAAPDVPVLRKGDRVKVNAGGIAGYFLVKGVTHDAFARTMAMELEPVPDVSENAADAQGATGKTAVCTGNGVRIRSGPGTGYSIKGAMYKGQKAEVLGEQEGWYQIRYGGISGWVSAQYFTV